VTKEKGLDEMVGRKCRWQFSLQLCFSLTAADYHGMISNAQKLPSKHMKCNTTSKLLTYDFVPLINVVSSWE
jgi:hypothetical protein